MPRTFEVISGRVVNPGAALTALTPNTGDTFNVRNFSLQSAASLEDIWTMGAAAQVVRVRSPKLHDFSNGLRLVSTAGVTRGLLPDEGREPLYPSDGLTVESTGGAAETDSVALLVRYEDLPGQQARLAGWDELKPRIAHLVGLQTTVAAPATAGDYAAGVGIDTTAGALKANTDYAILGYDVDTQCLLVGFQSTDFGSLRLGGPGGNEPDDTRGWFIDLSRRTGDPYIPIFNSNNKGNVLVSVAKVALTATQVGVILAELK